jgi:hypothetical protein
MPRDLLTAEGVEIGRLHVATLMKRMGIEAIYRKPNASKPAPGHKIYPADCEYPWQRRREDPLDLVEQGEGMPADIKRCGQLEARRQKLGWRCKKRHAKQHSKPQRRDGEEGRRPSSASERPSCNHCFLSKKRIRFTLDDSFELFWQEGETAWLPISNWLP